jgi:hypothetical protein
MGTRNLTVVIHKGEIRMAQYGQWDGYPDGVGRDIAKVLDGRSVVDFRKAIEKCVFIDDATLEKYYKDAGHDGGQFVNMDVSGRVKAAHPLLNRDYSGGAALKVMIEAPLSTTSFELRDGRDFAADSLFCEWAYVIDLDKETVEIYKGFNNTPLTESDRFFFLQDKAQKARSGETYYPVRLMKSYAMKDFNEQAITDLCEEMAAKAE